LPSGEDLKKTVEALKDTDALTQALRELSVEFPSLLRPLIHERDEFMVMQLRMMGRRPGVENVVAVVGAGHCRGCGTSGKRRFSWRKSRACPPRRTGSGRKTLCCTRRH
jgi:pheromone shutdown protein TraB